MSNNFVAIINNGPVPPVEGAVIFAHTDSEGDLWYKVLNNDKEMTGTEIENMYGDYHVYVTNCVWSEFDELLKGIPRIISNTPCGGAEQGVYDEYDAMQYGDTAAM